MNTINSKESDLRLQNYRDFYNESGYTSKFSNVIVIVILISILTGLFGFYLGDRGILKKAFAFTRTQIAGESSEATTYTEEELSKKIDFNKYDFNLYTQIIGNLKDKYVDSDKIDDKKLFEGSLKGLVESIGDNATTYFNAEEYKEYLASFSGAYEGIGIRLEYKDNRVIIVDVLKDSPAKEAGVRPFTYINKIDGKDVSTDSIDEIVTKIQGKKGTKVSVTFLESNPTQEITKEIIRSSIFVDSMRLIEKDKDTVIFEITRFTENTVAEWNTKWDKNVAEIISKNYKNVILDMRGNGGGFLDSGIHAANDLLPKGKLIVSERSKIMGDKDVYSTKDSPKLTDKKVVIITNNGTASASEIVAGALKHHGSAKIVGTQTFGKGTVQRPYELPDGGMLKITTEYWLLPDGKRLDNDNPIKPDIEVKQDEEQFKQGKDNILEEAIKSL